MKNKILIWGLVSVLIVLIPLLVWTNPGITVSPTQHDFGEVEVGSSSSTIITIQNEWWGDLTINSVRLQIFSGSDITITNPPVSGTVINPGSAMEFFVTYTPSTEEFVSAMIDIRWTNGETGTSFVDLLGTGVWPSPGVTIEDILAFLDESVIAGTLEGKGPGKSAIKRLFVLRRSIETVGKLIDRGRIRAACVLLWIAYRRCDDIRMPPDFVQGEATSELANMIQDLRDALGCNLFKGKIT